MEKKEISNSYFSYLEMFAVYSKVYIRKWLRGLLFFFEKPYGTYNSYSSALEINYLKYKTSIQIDVLKESQDCTVTNP